MGSQRVGHDWPTELFQILKDDAVKVLYSICQQIWKTQQFSTGLATGLTFSSQFLYKLNPLRKAKEKNVFWKQKGYILHRFIGTKDLF